jgi:hypothetical protein
VKRVAIVQSNYLPWKGYFDLIASVDEMVLYDDAQYTKRDWRNRNQIKTANGLLWLSVPVKVKGRFFQAIKDTELVDEPWAETHWRSIAMAYGRAPHFAALQQWLEPALRGHHHQHLSSLNRSLIEAICGVLGIRTRITSSSDYTLPDGKTERLLAVCEQAKATMYVSGPAARSYLDESLFAARGIGVEWFDYSGYPEYPQLWGAFEHAVSVVDLLAMCGPDAPRYLKHVAAPVARAAE